MAVPEDEQPAAFMDFSIRLGVDDLTVRASASAVREAHKQAEKEITRISDNFNRYLNGEVGPWLVPAERMTDRLDVKYCIPQQGRYVKVWEEKGYEVKPLSLFVDEVEEVVVPKAEPEEDFRLLRVQYDGECIEFEIRKGTDVKYNKMNYVRAGDLVVSNIGGVMGAIGLISDEMDGCVVSSEYTVLRCKKRKTDAVYLWTVLRSSELRADLLSTSSGLNRHRLKWAKFKDVLIPVLSDEERLQIYEDFVTSRDLQKKAQRSKEKVFSTVYELLDVESESSKARFIAAKPPR